jgi:hypothetical protein
MLVGLKQIGTHMANGETLDADTSVAKAGTPKKARNKSGRQIYFIEAVGVGLVKIGYANNIERRMLGFQTASAVPLKLLGVAPGGHERERELHELLSDYRHHGEWFRRCRMLDDVIAAFSIAGQVAEINAKMRALEAKRGEYLIAHIEETFDLKRKRSPAQPDSRW